jgi:hypothetical protein
MKSVDEMTVNNACKNWRWWSKYEGERFADRV